jgi:uncharacterized cofD-like protein
MMEQYSGDFLAAVDGLRTLLGCHGRVWPVSVEQASVCAQYGDGSQTRGEVEVDAGQTLGRPVQRIWLEPEVGIHPAVDGAIRTFDAAIIGPGSFYTSLMPILLVRGVREALQAMAGPVVLVTNLLTEGRGMQGFTAAEAVTRIGEAVGRPIDVAIVNTGHPSPETLARYVAEHKEPSSSRATSGRDPLRGTTVADLHTPFGLSSRNDCCDRGSECLRGPKVLKRRRDGRALPRASAR